MIRPVRFHRPAVLAAGLVVLTLAATVCRTPAAAAPGAASQPAAKTATGKAGKTGKTNPGKLNAKKGTMPVKPTTTPERIEVQHILIGFATETPGKPKESSVPGKAITRTKDEARALAHKILDEARAGTPFDTLVVKYTEDSPPGIYAMSGVGVAPKPGEYARNKMVAAFGDVGFNISVGNIDIAEYDADKSPYGWHIIKRLK